MKDFLWMPDCVRQLLRNAVLLSVNLKKCVIGTFTSVSVPGFYIPQICTD